MYITSNFECVNAEIGTLSHCRLAVLLTQCSFDTMIDKLLNINSLLETSCTSAAASW